MEITYGDILTTDAKYIGHCVNAQYAMNSGVAKAIRERYPKAYQDYMDSPALPLGKVILSKNEPHNILHIVGQKYYGYKGGRYVSYPALRKGFNTINKNLAGNKIALPRIGCGLAGGEWSIVSEIIEEELKDMDVVVYYLNDEIPY